MRLGEGGRVDHDSSGPVVLVDGVETVVIVGEVFKCKLNGVELFKVKEMVGVIKKEGDARKGWSSLR